MIRTMDRVVSLPIASWADTCSPAEQERALSALEGGSVLLLPQLPFAMNEGERPLLSAAIAGKSKNVSFDGASGRLRGSSASESQLPVLRTMVERYANASRALLRNLLPRYEEGLVQGRTSFRPAQISNREISWRKDDTRLHVDSFPSSPVRGRRILRVFSNVNPAGETRTWRIGEPFETVARHYLPSLPAPVWGSSAVLKFLHVTKGVRSDYDHYMLRMHDRMKSDLDYQARADQVTFEFPAGCSWIVFTDQVSHAAMKGQYAFEQTFYLPVESMGTPAQAPLRVLERLKGRALA
jgi:3-deoxy-D-manno-oct-2-ulosonic acid (Kdo) hydroxylase